VRLASPIGSAAGGSENVSTSLSNVAKLAAHPKFVWVFKANYDGTIIYNDPVQQMSFVSNGGKFKLYAVPVYLFQRLLRFSFERMISLREKIVVLHAAKQLFDSLLSATMLLTS
jgi:hypothetical protein